MLVENCEKNLCALQEAVEFLSSGCPIHNTNAIRPQISQKQKTIITHQIRDLIDKIQELIGTMKKLNRIHGGDPYQHTHGCERNLTNRLTQSQDSMMVDKNTIIDFQKRLNEILKKIA